tara:strand:- start:444 stop:671 length:228 start_codon:yes stop_codon:yes gene_type:complete
MKITENEIRRIIREVLLEQGCADRDEGCIKQSSGGEYGPAGTWYILNNKKGGVWKKGFKSKQSAKNSLGAMHARK